MGSNSSTSRTPSDGTPKPANIFDVVGQTVQKVFDEVAEANKPNTPEEEKLLKAAVSGDNLEVKALLDQGANINCRNVLGHRPVYLAAMHNRLTTMRLLIELKANINAISQSSRTPLLIAIEKKNFFAAQLLIEAKADLTICDETRENALHKAVYVGSPIVQTLIEHKMDVNLRGKLSWFPLFYASVGDHPDTVQLLLEHGARIDDVTSDKHSCMHVAGERGAKVLELLIANGAKTNHKDNWDRTPVDKAAQGGPEVVERMEKALKLSAADKQAIRQKAIDDGKAKYDAWIEEVKQARASLEADEKAQLELFQKQAAETASAAPAVSAGDTAPTASAGDTAPTASAEQA